jgi:hypothetical protein
MENQNQGLKDQNSLLSWVVCIALVKFDIDEGQLV